ncbi:MAG: peptidoglycan editing factor PgeF, partial [Clostridiales bacterium]|nr:peptidoglycan editing factor PgeF [Clostridiales bacterium]
EAADRGKGFFPSDIKQTDGLYTNVPNLALATFSADCAPILFLDPVKKVIAAIHSGWRGTAARIAQKLIAALNKEFKSNPADILAGIGPSIGPCCFEVDSPVAEQFSDWREFIIEGKAQNKEKFNVDLWRINESMLIEAGLKPENIDCAPLCTCCNSDLYFSHRRDKDARGSMASIISLGV